MPFVEIRKHHKFLQPELQILWQNTADTAVKPASHTHKTLQQLRYIQDSSPKTASSYFALVYQQKCTFLKTAPLVFPIRCRKRRLAM